VLINKLELNEFAGEVKASSNNQNAIAHENLRRDYSKEKVEL